MVLLSDVGGGVMSEHVKAPALHRLLFLVAAAASTLTGEFIIIALRASESNFQLSFLIIRITRRGLRTRGDSAPAPIIIGNCLARLQKPIRCLCFSSWIIMNLEYSNANLFIY